VVRVVEAAGGVVWRASALSRAVEVLVVHRPRRRDWSLPKGKLEAGESHLAAAIREVEEETGLRCEPGLELPSTRYNDRKGRDKLVRYWAMTAVSGEFSPNPEVDEVRWLAVADTPQLLTYRHDLVVVAGLELVLA
jgi:8-oxo-dGTP diphosphatase